MGRGSKPEAVVREIRRKTRRKYSAEERIRIVLEGLRGEESIAELCRREGTLDSHAARVAYTTFLFECGASIAVRWRHRPSVGGVGDSHGKASEGCRCRRRSRPHLWRRLANQHLPYCPELRFRDSMHPAFSTPAPLTVRMRATVVCPYTAESRTGWSSSAPPRMAEIIPHPGPRACGSSRCHPSIFKRVYKKGTR